MRMDKSLIVIFLMDVLRSTMGEAEVCLSGWHYNSKVNKCYKLFLVKQMVTDAQASCRNNGADLAMPKTRLENDALGELRQQSQDQFLWIGASDSKVEGYWKWNDGDDVDWTNWKNGEPNHIVAGEDCMIVSKLGGKWFDSVCDVRMPFICEMTVPEPVLSIFPVGRDVEPYTEIKLRCSVKSQWPKMTYKFYHDNKRAIHSYNSVWTLQSVEFKDSGTYTCQAIFPNGLVSNNSTVLDIFVKEEPVLSLIPVGQDVEPYTEIKLSCSLKSLGPIMTYKFYHVNKLINHSSDSVMTLPSVEFKDSGNYTCQAILPNGLGSRKSTILDILVKEIPVCSTNSTSRSIEPGSTLEFICTLRTKMPGMNYTFYYKGNTFRSGASHVIRKRNVEFENSGAYTCDVLYNGRRSVMSTRHVIIVPGCPVPEGDDEYMQRLLSSITPREETTRWGPAPNKGVAKSHQEQEDNLDHDEL